MRVYYLSDPLSAAELAEAAELLECAVEPVRVPYVLPVIDFGEGRSLDDAPLSALRAAGVLSDAGRATGLVEFDPPHWMTRVADAIGRLTGVWPYLIQPPRTRIGSNLDRMRVINLDAAMRQ